MSDMPTEKLSMRQHLEDFNAVIFRPQQYYRNKQTCCILISTALASQIDVLLDCLNLLLRDQ